jgi:putative peptide zinc metalloprotease protein
MLCRVCRRQLRRSDAACGGCGTPTGRGPVPLDLVLPDKTRVPLIGSLTIGRASSNDIRLTDPSVSRKHARIDADSGEARLEDVGSSSGTYVDGRRLRSRTRLLPGAVIELGDTHLEVERRRKESEAGRTIVVRAGSTLIVPTAGPPELAGATICEAAHPRVRSGWALKRLDDAEGAQRFVLRDLVHDRFVRMGAEDAALFQLLDGTRSLRELVTEAERQGGPAGRARLARLLADLGERGLLAGVDGPGDDTPPARRLARLLRPRHLTVRWLGPLCERIYRRGGFLLFTRPAYVLLGVVTLGGATVFAGLVVGRYGTPFVVAGKVGLGGLVFVVGRLLIVSIHELAHGLTVVSFGRHVSRAGLKLLLVFPYAFVDTSEAWFESRRRRIAISAAGPVTDFALGGLFSLAALSLSNVTIRDVFFNLALAAYIGGFFNLNPVLDRDGYHMLVDLLREPGLRKRSRAWLVGRLSGAPRPADDSRALRLHAVATAVWSLSGLAFAILLTTSHYAELAALAPPGLVIAGFAALYVIALLPFFVLVAWPLAGRLRRKETGVASATS